MNPKTVAKLKTHISRKNFNRDEVAKVSSAAAALCSWVIAIYSYSGVIREVAPKREALQQAQRSLGAKQAALHHAQQELANVRGPRRCGARVCRRLVTHTRWLSQVTAKINSLQQQFDQSAAEKNQIKAEADQLHAKLEVRALTRRAQVA